MKIHPANYILNLSIKNNEYFSDLNSFVTTCYIKNHEFKEKNGRPLWHPSCFIPYEYYLDFCIEKAEKKHQKKITLTQKNHLILTKNAMLLHILAAWRYSGGIYRFDTDVYQYLLNSETEVIIPDILFNLPEWSLFIETPGLKYFDEDIFGFFANFDQSEKRLYLKVSILILNCPKEPSLIYLILDLGFDTLTESLEEIAKTRLYALKKTNSDLTDKSVLENLINKTLEEQKLFKKILPLLLYLCIEEPEIENHTFQEKPKKTQPTKKKGGFQFYPVNSKIWHIGSETGHTIREYEKNKELYKKNGITKPHIRRAHFHVYWKGSRKQGNQTPELKWLLPIPVGMKNIKQEKY